MASKLPMGDILTGVGQRVGDMFKGSDKVYKDKPNGKNQPETLYPTSGTIEQRLKYIAKKYDEESTFEKFQFSRKWFRNLLMYMGYHELEWSEVNVAWEALIRDGGDYAFPNNRYRSAIRYGAALYVQTSPEFIIQPTSEDYESQAVAEAGRIALDVIKENVKFDAIRVFEAINLRLFGNSFRYNYYSLDPRYGSVEMPVFQDVSVEIPGHDGLSQCPQCGMVTAPGTQQCPVCGGPMQQQPPSQPTTLNYPSQQGTTNFPRGQEMCEVCWPMEIYVRSSSKNLWSAPFLERKRNVDRLALQAVYPKASLGGTADPGGSAFAAAEDLSLIYQESVADLPSDPTQYAVWYERVTGPAKVTYQQTWVRPALYAIDKQLTKEFPDGVYIATSGDTLLEARNDSLDDHWTHFCYIPVPGRFWGDGDDDLIPKQLQLNESERLIMRNVSYNSVPLLLYDKQRIDPKLIVNDGGQMVPVKMAGGQPIKNAAEWFPGSPLTQEVHQWRQNQIDDMEYHSGTFGAAVGQHTPGEDTYGQTEQLAQKSQGLLTPYQLLYKESNEEWAMQMLRIAAKNWLDPRVSATMGINGQWEFKKLRAEMLKMDKLKVVCRVVPLDFQQQQAFAQAVATGVLNPQDPRVSAKALELYQLPTELSTFTNDAKAQWKKIEQMKAGQPVTVVAFRDNDQVAAEIDRVWLNSDDAEKAPPEVVAAVYANLLQHIESMQTVAQAMGMIQQAGAPPVPSAVAPGAPGGGTPQAGGGGGQPPPNKNNNPQFRQQRAQAGQAAKPKQPQPPGGNQNGVGRRGNSPSATRNRAQGKTK